MLRVELWEGQQRLFLTWLQSRFDSRSKERWAGSYLWSAPRVGSRIKVARDEVTRQPVV